MILNRKICKNGRSWSEKEECLHSYNRKEQDYVSPAIIYEEGLYKMWYVAKKKIFYVVSKDAKNWGRPIEIPVEYGDNYEWGGVYARPQDKPSALDTYDQEEEK